MKSIRGFILGVIAALGLSCGTTANAQSRWDGVSSFTLKETETLAIIHQLAWAMACEAKKAKCAAFIPPYVGYAMLPSRLGQYLPGELIVQVDIRLLGQPVSALVVAHEMVHYLQFITGQLDAKAANFLDTCAREQEAFTLVWAMDRKYKLAKGDKRLLTWEQARPFYYICGGKP